MRRKELEEKLYQHTEFERYLWIRKQRAADKRKENLNPVQAAIDAELAYQRYDALHQLIVCSGLEKTYKDWLTKITKAERGTKDAK